MSSNILIDPASERAEEQEQIDLEVEQPAADPELPEKYRGKSVMEIVEMHRNAETELGRRANEVGHYRSLIDELITVKREKDLQENPAELDERITADELLADPESALTRVIKKHIKPLETANRESAARTEVQKFYDEFPDADQIAQDPEFHEFIKRKPSRLADAQLASKKDGMDLAAARRLLENYNDFKESTKPAEKEVETETDEIAEQPQKPTGVKGARTVATERSGDSSPPGKKLFYKTDVVDLMISNPDKYKSDSYQKQLLAAIKEGRLRD